MDGLSIIMVRNLGGGKLTNHGIVSTKSRAIGANSNYKIYWDYPVESNVYVTITTSRSNYDMETVKGNSVSFNTYTLGQGESFTGIASISPTEDDTYIYEVAIDS